MTITTTGQGPSHYQDQLLDRHLGALLGGLEPEALALLRSELQWVEIAAGDTLMAQGEPGDSMYLSISGRLRAYIRDEDGVERMVREMARGQVIGEMALYTDEPRSATVVAIRDSVLVRLDKSAFTRLLSSSAQVSIALTRQLIRRLQTAQARSDFARPVTIGLLPLSAGVNAAEFTPGLAEQLTRLLRDGGPTAQVCVVDAGRVDRELQQPAWRAARPTTWRPTGASRCTWTRSRPRTTTCCWSPTTRQRRTQRVSRRCDEMLLLADAT